MGKVSDRELKDLAVEKNTNHACADAVSGRAAPFDSTRAGGVSYPNQDASNMIG